MRKVNEMEKNNFINLLTVNIKDLKESSGVKDENDKLLRLVKLALERLKHNRSNSDAFDEYDRLDLKKMFVALCTVAKEANDFILDASTSSKSVFNPASSSKELHEKLKDIVSNINQVKSDIESIERNNAELLQQEVNLRKCNDDRKSAKNKVDELQEILKNGAADISNYEKQCLELITNLNEIEAKRNHYALHLESNSAIAMHLSRYGFTTVQEFIGEVQGFENAVKAELTKYDNKIKNALEQREQLKRKIEDMQGRL